MDLFGLLERNSLSGRTDGGTVSKLVVPNRFGRAAQPAIRGKNAQNFLTCTVLMVLS